MASLNVQADDAGVTITMSLRFRDGYDRDMKVFTQTVDGEGSSSGWTMVPSAPAAQ
jgi:hypothetical protein